MAEVTHAKQNTHTRYFRDTKHRAIYRSQTTLGRFLVFSSTLKKENRRTDVFTIYRYGLSLIPGPCTQLVEWWWMFFEIRLILIPLAQFMCTGYGSWIITTHQEQLISFIQSTGHGEHPLRAALKPRYITSQHTIHQASEEIISQRIALKPRLYIHMITVTKHPNTNNVSPWRTTSVYSSGLRLATPVGCAGLLRTMPDYFKLCRTTSGLLRSTRPDTGVLGTRPEDQPGPRGNYLLDFLSPLCRIGLHVQLPD